MGVINVRGDAATAPRRRRATDFSRWLGDSFFFGEDPAVYEYAIDPAIGPNRSTPISYKSAFKSGARVPSDFGGRAVPQASYAGYYVAAGRDLDAWARLDS